MFNILFGEIMAENKKSFVLYTDIIHVFANLTNEESGKLIKHLLEYVNDKDPQTNDRIIQIAFEPIKLQLKRDLKHWESVVNKRKDAGKLGGLAKASKGKQDLANLAVNDNVNVNVNDTVNDTVNVKVNVINIIEQYFKDFENGTHIVEIARLQKTTPEKLKEFIPFFKLKVNSEYQSYGKFIDHFRNSWLLNKDKINNNPQKGGRVLD